MLDALVRRSRHAWNVETLPPRGWKWRMRTAAGWARGHVLDHAPDVLFVSDYLDLAELRALLPPGRRDVPALAYFHESQATFPLRPGERVDHQFALTNLATARTADVAAFNSAFHRRSFFDAMERLARHVPDLPFADEVREARERAEVLSLGTDAPLVAPRALAPGEPVRVVWPHRAEHDKGPDALLAAMRALADDEGFLLELVGPRFRERPEAFGDLAELLGPRLVEHGFLPDRRDYLAVLARAHVSLSTAAHEFFGIAALESLRAGCLPVWPDDLAYPELLPEALRRAPYLHPRAEGAAAALRAAFVLVREGAHLAPVAEAAAATGRFAWDAVAPAFDDALERAVRASTSR